MFYDTLQFSLHLLLPSFMVPFEFFFFVLFHFFLMSPQTLPKAKVESAKNYNKSLVGYIRCYPLKRFGNKSDHYCRDLLQSTCRNACFILKKRGLPWWIDMVQFFSTILRSHGLQGWFCWHSWTWDTRLYNIYHILQAFRLLIIIFKHFSVFLNGKTFQSK